MAKKNKVIIMGYIDKILNKECNVIRMKVKKNDKKYIYPIVQINKNYGDDLKEGKVASLMGHIRTEYKGINYNCPNEFCNGIIKYNYLFTKVEAEEFHILEEITSNPYMNQVILLGPVCRDKNFKYIQGTKSPVAYTKYQLAVGRRVPSETDYPWIVTYARQAEEDNNRIVVGSQVLVDGMIITRNNVKKCECNVCGATMEINETLTEVQGATVEYLNNCVF